MDPSFVAHVSKMFCESKSRCWRLGCSHLQLSALRVDCVALRSQKVAMESKLWQKVTPDLFMRLVRLLACGQNGARLNNECFVEFENCFASDYVFHSSCAVMVSMTWWRLCSLPRQKTASRVCSMTPWVSVRLEDRCRDAAL